MEKAKVILGSQSVTKIHSDQSLFERELAVFAAAPDSCPKLLRVYFSEMAFTTEKLAVAHQAYKYHGMPLEIIQQRAARALAEFHAQGICHGDFRAEHILFDARGACKLVDFETAAPWTSDRAAADLRDAEELAFQLLNPQTREVFLREEQR